MSATRAWYTSFTELFPPPHFLEMPTVGLDISDRTVRFAELKRCGPRFRLGSYGEERIPDGVVEDGYIKDKAKLAEILKTLKHAHGLHFIKASLPEEMSYLFKTTIPTMNASDIHDALQFKIEENVPISVAEAVYDYRITRPPRPGDAELSISVTVVHTKVVSNYVDVFREAGLMPLALQIESQAIAHAAMPFGAEETYILIAIRGTRTVLSIVSQGEIQFTSTLPVGGESIAASIKKNLNINSDEVEKIRQGKELRESNDMFLSLVSAATALRDEIQKLIIYWSGHCQEFGEGQAIESVLLSGSDALLGIDDYLSRSLDMKVTIVNPWTNILSVQADVPPLTLREALDYVSALGLALPYD